MKTVTVNLTDQEFKALSLIAVSPEEWVNNVAKSRASQVIDKAVEDSGLGSSKSTPERKTEVFDGLPLETAKVKEDNKIAKMEADRIKEEDK